MIDCFGATMDVFALSFKQDFMVGDFLKDTNSLSSHLQCE